uniref:DUF1618 domain-containing protein n=1 Tax=Leersia perrieri TaxID=77586 RepID=A0A0D9XHM7_9ORYZ
MTTKTATLLELLLAPARGDEEGGSCSSSSSSSFRVVCRARADNFTVFVFFSGTGIWRAATFAACHYDFAGGFILPHFLHGCVYWRCWTHVNRMLMLDICDMDFFFFTLPSRTGIHRAIGDGGEEGRFGVFDLDCDDKVYMLSKPIRGSADEQWRHDGTIPLLPGLTWRTVKPVKGYLLLEGDLGYYSPVLHYFTLDLKTFVLERLCSLPRWNNHTSLPLYTSFLSSLSPNGLRDQQPTLELIVSAVSGELVSGFISFLKSKYPSHEMSEEKQLERVLELLLLRVKALADAIYRGQDVRCRILIHENPITEVSNPFPQTFSQNCRCFLERKRQNFLFFWVDANACCGGHMIENIILKSRGS